VQDERGTDVEVDISGSLNSGETQRTGLQQVEEPARNYKKKDVMTDEVIQC
jgi:hypothetical protein